MKKTILILLCCIMTFAFCGCYSNDNTKKTDLATQYYNFAQQCINEGDVDKAKQALEEGVAQTGNSQLQQMLDELNSDIQNEYQKYAGNWSVHNQQEYYFFTELTLKIELHDTKMDLLLKYEYLPENYDYNERPNTIAEISKTVDVSEIEDNILVLNYDDDGCGNSGKIKLSFSDTFILCESDYFTQDSYFWGFCFDMSKFEKDKDS